MRAEDDNSWVSNCAADGPSPASLGGLLSCGGVQAEWHLVFTNPFQYIDFSFVSWFAEKLMPLVAPFSFAAGVAEFISSIKSVPPSAARHLPALSESAPVNAPLTWPNSSEVGIHFTQVTTRCAISHTSSFDVWSYSRATARIAPIGAALCQPRVELT